MEEEKENATTDSQPTTLENEKSDVDLLFFDFVYALRYFEY